uniref:Uncharacterized protein n=1 Tax=Glossina brevipalpis TaxID=37001 RepID=A0A1A9W652_9MUSC
MASSNIKSGRFVTPLKKLRQKRADDTKSLQQTSVNLVVFQALNALQIIKNTTITNKLKLEPIPHFLYRWTQEHRPRNVSVDNVWFQRLLTDCNEESMAVEKLQIDITEIIAFMLLILNNYIEDGDPEEVQSLLNDAVSYVSYYEQLQKEMQDYKKSVYAKLAFDFISLMKKPKKTEPNPDELNLDNIKVRATLNYEDSRRCQMELMLNLTETELINKINEQNDILYDEVNCSAQTMNAYYFYQDELIRKYTKMERNYSNAEENLTHKTEVLKKKIQRLKDSYDFYQEEYRQIKEKISSILSINQVQAIRRAQLDRRLASKWTLMPKSSSRLIKLKKVKGAVKSQDVPEVLQLQKL